ncbi:MAG: OmpA family protein [Elusimicrobiota bacterium]
MLKPRNVIDFNDPRVAKIGHPAPPWLVNYADLMTEMVCFFIILYALSAALNKNVQNAKKEIEQMMQEQKLAGEVKMNKEGLQITFEEKGKMAFFESGKADITAPMLAILDKLAPTLFKLNEKFDITVEGHTDNVPIHSEQFPSNWELSTARATNVVKYLINNKSFSPARLAAIGYGEYRPVGPNDTEENKAKNRRVVFFVKTSGQKFQPGKGGGE